MDAALILPYFDKTPLRHKENPSYDLEGMSFDFEQLEVNERSLKGLVMAEVSQP